MRPNPAVQGQAILTVEPRDQPSAAAPCEAVESPSSSRSSSPTPCSIGPHRPSKINKSPCPALNALCNHGAYGMPKDGQGVRAGVLANALVHVYGLNRVFAYGLSYSAILGINKGRSLTLNLDQLTHSPIAHFAPLVHLNPSERTGRVDGRSSPHLVGLMLEQDINDPTTFDLHEFSQWRLFREAQVDKKMPIAHKAIAAGELALLLQVFGDPQNDYAVPRQVVADFLDHEKLPENWEPTRSVGVFSTLRVADRIRSAMAGFDGRFHTPVYARIFVVLSAIAGVIYVLKLAF